MVHRAGFLVLILLAGAPVRAQEQPVEHDHSQHEHATTVQAASGWTWSADANVFVAFNYQARRYFDIAAWESQNWMMGAASRPIGSGRLTLDAMASVEPATVGHGVYRVDDGDRFAAPGSPQIFQTGEMYKGLPIMEYQHPHDLLMGLGATYERTEGRLTYIAGADLVGSPT